MGGSERGGRRERVDGKVGTKRKEMEGEGGEGIDGG